MKPLFRIEEKLMDVDDFLDRRELVSNQLHIDFEAEFNEAYEEELDKVLA